MVSSAGCHYLHIQKTRCGSSSMAFRVVGISTWNCVFPQPVDRSTGIVGGCRNCSTSAHHDCNTARVFCINFTERQSG